MNVDADVGLDSLRIFFACGRHMRMSALGRRRVNNSRRTSLALMIKEAIRKHDWLLRQRCRKARLHEPVDLVDGFTHISEDLDFMGIVLGSQRAELGE